MKSKKYLLIFISVIAILFVSEMFFRLVGYKPGIFRKQDGFEIVDSLIEYDNFTTDEAGIYKFSPLVTDSIRQYYNCETEEIESALVKTRLYPVDRVEEIYNTFCRLSHGENSRTLKLRIKHWMNKKKFEQPCELENTLHKISSQPIDTSDDWAQAIFEYVHKPFNEEGFRSIAFKKHKTKHKRILIIGDSFVYGMSAIPFTNSFTDILLARGYMVYAAGIPGTDPAQYAAITKKYVPFLKPDLIISCFYFGNDLMRFYRPTVPNQPNEHITNAGFFNSYPLGNYLSAAEAYDYYKCLASIPHTTFFNKLCAQTCIGSVLWNICYNYKWVSHTGIEEYDKYNSLNCNPKFTKKYVQIVDSVGLENNIPILHTIIPQYNSLYNINREYLTIDTSIINQIFTSHFFCPMDMSARNDYDIPGYHFNNSGATKFANFLESLIMSKTYNEEK
ncbi:MAG: hypothetical protein U0T74_01735 [Chitinophagales bacterium]